MEFGFDNTVSCHKRRRHAFQRSTPVRSSAEVSEKYTPAGGAAETISCRNLTSSSGLEVISHCQQSTAVLIASIVNNSTCDQAMQCSRLRFCSFMEISRAVACHRESLCRASERSLHACHTLCISSSASFDLSSSPVLGLVLSRASVSGAGAFHGDHGEHFHNDLVYVGIASGDHHASQLIDDKRVHSRGNSAKSLLEEMQDAHPITLIGPPPPFTNFRKALSIAFRWWKKPVV
nr:unnamed protein product [Callosobruchus chinensis]